MIPATRSGHLTDEVETIAFKNPDGSVVLILTNATEADLVYEFKVDGEQTQKLRCPARAIQTWVLEQELKEKSYGKIFFTSYLWQCNSCNYYTYFYYNHFIEAAKKILLIS